MRPGEPTLFDDIADVSPMQTLPSTDDLVPVDGWAPKGPTRTGKRRLNVTTEGIKYAGSKLKLIPYILQLVQGLPVRTVFDGFSGTTRVSQAFAKHGYSVVSNDMAVWSECFATAYLLNRKHPSEYAELIEHLNAVPAKAGWFSETYGGVDIDGSAVHSDGSKRLWQMHNAAKLDGIRAEIRSLNLDATTESVALTSLVLALDRVDSTMGHFVAYLREWSPRSRNDLHLQVPRLFPNTETNFVLRKEVFDAVKHLPTSVDIAYLDPPYGSNNEKMPPSRVRYQSYYHIWKTVILDDRPEIFGAAKRRTDSSDTFSPSLFEEFRKSPSGRFIVTESIDRLIEETPAPFVVLSYSSGGRATAHELDEILRKHGKLLKVVEIEHKRNVMSGMRWTNEWLRDSERANVEFLFLVEKG